MNQYDNIFEEIKAKAPLIEEIEDSGTAVIPAGHDRMKCCCPLHNEKTPSLMIYSGDEFDSYYCFGCGSGGDVINFVKELYEFNGFKEVINYFAKKYRLETLDKSEQDLEEIFFEENRRVENRSKGIYNYAISSSRYIREFLKSSENPNEEFQKMSSYMRNIDGAIEGKNMDSLKNYREMILDYINRKKDGVKKSN